MFSVALLWLIFHRVPTLFCCKPYTRAMKRPASSSTSVQMKRPASSSTSVQMKRPASSSTSVVRALRALPTFPVDFDFSSLQLNNAPCSPHTDKPMKPLHGTLKNCNVDNEESVLTAKPEFHNLIQITCSGDMRIDEPNMAALDPAVAS